MSTSSILYDITIYGAHTCLSGPYKYSLRFSESGRILKKLIRQIKFTWSVNYVSEIFHSSINDTIGTRARRINRAAALCCHVALTYGAAILRLENEARHANFEEALFQSVTKYIQHPLKSMWNTAVGIKNCKQLFSLRLAFTTQKKQHTQRRWCPYHVLLFFGSWMQAVMKKVVYSFPYRLRPGQVGREVFHMLLKGGSTRLKITWVQQRQHHRVQESARERMLNLALRQSETHLVCLSCSAESATNVISPRHKARWNTRGTPWSVRESFSDALGGAREKYQMCFTLP